MNSKKLFQQMFGLVLAVFLLTGCGGVPTKSTAIPAPSPPTSTPDQPPTPTPRITPTPTNTPTHTPMPVPTSNTGKVKGKVFWSDSNKPISKAEISLQSDKGEIKVETDAQGNYSFAKPVAGKYMMSFALVLEAQNATSCKEFKLRKPKGTGNWVTVLGFNKNGNPVIISVSESVNLKAGGISQMDFNLSCK